MMLEVSNDALNVDGNELGDQAVLRNDADHTLDDVGGARGDEEFAPDYEEDALDDQGVAPNDN